MGDRYFVQVTCPKCGNSDSSAYYAPTCGFTHWECSNCGHSVDLGVYTEISYEDCSNQEEISQLCKEVL